MDHKDARHFRLRVLAGLFLAVMAVYLGVLFNVQVNDHDYYYASSIRTIAQTEAVEAARGNITDRSGRMLVSSRSSYNLTFDASLLDGDDDASEAILRLLTLCRDRGLDWADALPITRAAPFSYTLDALDAAARRRFLTYLKEDLDGAAEALGDYLLAHPSALTYVDEDGDLEDPAEDILADEDLTDAQKADALLEKLTADQLTARLLEGAGLTPARLIALMREDLDVPASFTVAEARLVLGIQYEIRSRDLVRTDPYVLAEDVDAELISLLNDGDYAGAKITPSSVREYETTYAAHILGYLGDITAADDYWNTLEPLGYAMNDKIGRGGVEAAFESYLKGTDGVRVVSTNEEGKITGEYYSVEPVPGSTVELTVDLDLQRAVEDALAATIQEMDRSDPNDRRGGAAVVLDVDTREVLAMASYPTYDLATFRQPEIFAALNTDTRQPFNNRATQGHYAPGSTLKPLTAVAALEEGVISPTERIRTPSFWAYPNDPTGSGTRCAGGDHGRLNVTEAITKSCNYFFAEMGYRLGMDTFLEYLDAFGLGRSTGIEIGDYAGTLPENPEGQDRAPWAAFGQGNQDYTPLQIANYIATLVSGGELLQPHLLKAVKSYDNTEVLAVGQAERMGTVDISPETLEAVKKGMLGYTQPGGSVYNAFRSCVVTAGAKTGTSQLGGDQTENGLFVCFAPYDDPEIAVAIVIEHATWGSNVASTGVEILNAYFADDESGGAVTGENQLLP